MEHWMEFMILPYINSFFYTHILGDVALYDWVGVLVEEIHFSPWCIIMVMAHLLVLFMLHGLPL